MDKSVEELVKRSEEGIYVLDTSFCFTESFSPIRIALAQQEKLRTSPELEAKVREMDETMLVFRKWLKRSCVVTIGEVTWELKAGQRALDNSVEYHTRGIGHTLCHGDTLIDDLTSYLLHVYLLARELSQPNHRIGIEPYSEEAVEQINRILQEDSKHLIEFSENFGEEGRAFFERLKKITPLETYKGKNKINKEIYIKLLKFVLDSTWDHQGREIEGRLYEHAFGYGRENPLKLNTDRKLVAAAFALGYNAQNTPVTMLTRDNGISRLVEKIGKIISNPELRQRYGLEPLVREISVCGVNTKKQT